MKLRSVFAFLALTGMSLTVFGQVNTTSPYSSMGAGDLLMMENIEQAGMGGLSMVPLNPYSSSGNFTNPSANQNLRVTTFDIGVSNQLSRFNTGSEKTTHSTTYISNITLAFPVGNKARAGFGFRPYSTIGYDMATVTEGDEVSYSDKFSGSGGINSVHLIGSYNLDSNFSVGMRLNYLFGDLTKVETVSTSGLALNTDYLNKADVKGLQYALSGSYTKKIGDNKRLDIGASYTFGAGMTTHFVDMTTTYALNGLEPVNIDTVQYNKYRKTVKLPQSLSLGASFRKDLHWMFGAQIDWGDWGSFAFNKQTDVSLNSRFRVSAGGYWIPDFNSYKSYFNRITYRFGGFYESTPIKVNGEGLNKYGLTVGFGLPIGKERDASMLNLGAELGSMGNTKSLPFRENYVNFRAGFTINDFWFRKRMID